MKCIQKVICLLSVIFWAWSPVSADIYWESIVESKGKPQGMSTNLPQILTGHMNKSRTVRYYLSEQGLRTESSDSVMIMDFKTGTVYTLHPKNRTFMKAEPASDKGKEKKDAPDVQLIPTEETKEISGYSCRKYRIKYPQGEGEYWVSKDVGILDNYNKMREKIKKTGGKYAGFGRMNAPGLTAGTEGFPIMTRTEMMGISTTATVIKIEEKEAEPGRYKVPDNYKAFDIKNIFNLKPVNPN